MGVDKTVLPTGYRIMVDGAVYGEAWDKTAEELFLIQVVRTKAISSKIVNLK